MVKCKHLSKQKHWKNVRIQARYLAKLQECLGCKVLQISYASEEDAARVLGRCVSHLQNRSSVMHSVLVKSCLAFHMLDTAHNRIDEVASWSQPSKYSDNTIHVNR